MEATKGVKTLRSICDEQISCLSSLSMLLHQLDLHTLMYFCSTMLNLLLLPSRKELLNSF